MISALRSSAVARGAAQATLFLALPFVMLPWLVPFASPLTIGADYPVYAIAHQMTLQLSLRNGTFPLFVPGFALGQSAGAATLGQLFHPVAHLAAHVPGYWSGHALDVVTILDLLSLGATQLVLFRVLRALDARPTTAFLASFLAVWNLRTLDLFRYGASLQNGVGFLLTCAAALHLATRGPSAARVAALAGATYLLLCGGHPQMAYLGLLGAAAMGLAAPFLVDALRPPRAAKAATRARLAGRRATRARLSALVAIAGGIAAGVLLAAAYWAPLWLDFASDASARTAREFRWVWWPYRTASAWTLADDLMRPLHADVHGSFAGSALFLVPFLIPLLALVRPLPAGVWALWLLAVATLATALAPDLPLYRLLWTYLPGFASFRVPGRVTMLLPLPLALLLLWLVERGGDHGAHQGRIALAPAALLASAALVLLTTYVLVRGNTVDPAELAPPLAIRDVPALVQAAVPVLAVASLVTLALWAWRPRRTTAALLVACVATHQALLLGYGTWVQHREPTPTYAELMRRQREHLGFDGPAGAGMEAAVVTEYARRTGIPIAAGPLARLDDDVAVVATADDAYTFVRERAAFVGPEPPDAVVERPSPPATAGSALVATARTNPTTRSFPPRASNRGRVELVHATFNALVLRSTTPVPALLEVRQPFTQHWQARVDGAAAAVERTNALWLGVAVPAGTSVVELRYASPAATAGMLLSLATACALGVAIVLRSPRLVRSRARRSLAIVALGCAAIAAFALWQRSLHGGAHLGTRFRWPAIAPAAPTLHAARR